MRTEVRQPDVGSLFTLIEAVCQDIFGKGADVEVHCDHQNRRTVKLELRVVVYPSTAAGDPQRATTANEAESIQSRMTSFARRLDGLQAFGKLTAKVRAGVCVEICPAPSYRPGEKLGRILEVMRP